MALYEFFVGTSRNLATRNHPIVGLYELAVFVFVVLTIFYAASWWYVFVAIAIALASMGIVAAINKSINSSNTEIYVLACLFLFCPACIVLMYLDLFGII